MIEVVLASNLGEAQPASAWFCDPQTSTQPGGWRASGKLMFRDMTSPCL